MNAKLNFMLDVRRLRVLHAVSAYGSVTAAAAALGYSAPAVSQQLAALEREVGMRLTERAGRGLQLTPAALILVGHTDALLARLDAARSRAGSRWPRSRPRPRAWCRPRGRRWRVRHRRCGST